MQSSFLSSVKDATILHGLSCIAGCKPYNRWFLMTKWSFLVYSEIVRSGLLFGLPLFIIGVIQIITIINK